MWVEYSIARKGMQYAKYSMDIADTPTDAAVSK